MKPRQKIIVADTYISLYRKLERATKKGHTIVPGSIQYVNAPSIAQPYLAILNLDCPESVRKPV
jgi:hypothetical protein